MAAFFYAAPAPSLSHHRPPTWTSRHSNKDPPHFPSFPFPISLSVHCSFLSTVSGFVPRRLDTCDSSVTHHTHPCNMYAEEGPSTAGVRAESLLSLTTACRLKFPLPLRCCMCFFFFQLTHAEMAQICSSSCPNVDFRVIISSKIILSIFQTLICCLLKYRWTMEMHW